MPHPEDSHIQVRDAQAAFKSAIDAGLLSYLKDAPQWAGNYMYMYTAYGEGPNGEPVDYFKHIDTRKYISAIAT